MANSVKGEVVLNLHDGRALTVVMDFDALVEAESVYGKPLQQLMTDAQAGFMGAVRALLVGGLRTHHPELTVKDASVMLQTDAATVTSALAEAADAAFPKADGSAVEDKDGANPPGKASGRSGAKRA